MDTAFIVGNGESRNIFPITELKDKGTVYGCNAIYRDYPEICDYIVAVNPPMYEEILEWYNSVKYRSARSKPNLKIIGPEDVSKWNYIITGDSINDVPQGLKLYRIWRGGDYRKPNVIRTIDFSNSRGSGCSAVLHAAEAGFKNIIIMAFDIMGSNQTNYQDRGEVSREQNNIYKSSRNYPQRMNMKAYLKYEWLYHLRQTIRRFPDTNFYFINRLEYIRLNPYLRWYFRLKNIKCGIYADLKRWIDDQKNDIQWLKL